MNRAGEYIKNLSGEAEYKSFRPSALPPKPELDISSDMLMKLVKANTELARLDMASRLIPNTELFVSMYVRKEALLSSQIEGTQCTLDDVLDPNIDANRNLDVEEVVNYVRAASYALEKMKNLPLCSRLLKEIHRELMSGVRGQEKDPGEFRRSQNWIGPANCALKDARYIPPNVEDMERAMSDLEKYMNEGEKYDPLIRIALIHYQFETIHPFLDGNGRIGRLMILLYLIDQKILSKPVIYISYFLKKNQIEYYDRISEVRRSGNYEQWVSFFLEAVSAAAEDALQTIEKLSALHEKDFQLLPVSKRGKDAVRTLFDYIWQYPIIDIGKTAEHLGLSYNAVSNAVKKLMELGILRETTNASRNRVFAYDAYLTILRQ